MSINSSDNVNPDWMNADARAQVARTLARFLRDGDSPDSAANFKKLMGHSMNFSKPAQAEEVFKDLLIGGHEGLALEFAAGPANARMKGEHGTYFNMAFSLGASPEFFHGLFKAAGGGPQSLQVLLVTMAKNARSDIIADCFECGTYSEMDMPKRTIEAADFCLARDGFDNVFSVMLSHGLDVTHLADKLCREFAVVIAMPDLVFGDEEDAKPQNRLQRLYDYTARDSKNVMTLEKISLHKQLTLDKLDDLKVDVVLRDQVSAFFDPKINALSQASFDKVQSQLKRRKPAPRL